MSRSTRVLALITTALFVTGVALTRCDIEPRTATNARLVSIAAPREAYPEAVTTTTTTPPPPTTQATAPPTTAARASRGQSTPRPVPKSTPGGRRYTWAQVGPLLPPCECSSGKCNGTYRGYFQFTYSTWRSAGGSGDPEAASFAEQNARAEWLYYHADPLKQWPTCYRRALATLAARGE